jgi:hypothetical protein
MRRVVRYQIVAHFLSFDEPILILSDYWNDWVERLYVSERASVYQIFCPLGKGYFGA